MTPIDFWFDPVSPYAYLAFERLPEAFAGLSYSVAYRPIVFGALLKAFDHKGPAEIEPKRAWTFRQVHWLGASRRHRDRHAGAPSVQSARAVAARLGDRARARHAEPLRLRDDPAPRLARRRRRRGSGARCAALAGAARAARRSGERRQQAAPARRDRRGARARRLRRADARHRRQAVLGLRRPRHGRGLAARRSLVRRAALAARRRAAARRQALADAPASADRRSAAPRGFTQERSAPRFRRRHARKVVNIRVAVASGDSFSSTEGFHMVTSAVPVGANVARPMTREEKKVIFASSLGTVFEWYDFYLYGSLAAIIAQAVLRRASIPTAAFISALLAFAAGFLVRPVRRARVRPPRRHDRPQVHLPGDDPDHGPVDLHRRPAAQLRLDRHRGADHPDRPAPAAGPGARRRVRRRRDLRRRARAARQARRVHLVDPDHGHARPVPVADRHPRRARRSSATRPSTTGAGAFRSCSRSCCWSSRSGSGSA